MSENTKMSRAARGLWRSKDGQIIVMRLPKGTPRPWRCTFPVGFGGGVDERRFDTLAEALKFLAQA